MVNGDLQNKDFGGRIGGAASAWAGNVNRQIANKAKTLPGKFGRGVRRGIVGAVGGGTLAMLAAGAAAATGDPAKAAALMGAAGSAGYNFSNYYGDRLAKGAGFATKSARTAFWGKDLKAVEQHNFDRSILKSPELMDSLTKSLGSRALAENAIKQGHVQALLNNNITDTSKIGKALALQQKYEKSGMDSDQALQKSVAMAIWNRDSNPGIYNTYSREQTAWKESLHKRLTSGGLDATTATDQVNKILDDLAYFEE